MLAGILSVSSNFYWRGGDQTKQAADGKHLKFASSKGDLVGMFRAFSEWRRIILSVTSPSGKLSLESKDDEEDLASIENTIGSMKTLEVDDSLSDVEEGMDLLRKQEEIFTGQNEDAEIDAEEEDNLFEAVSTVSEVTDLSDDLESNEDSLTTVTLEEVKRMEFEESRILKSATHRSVRKWCSENCINNKSLQIALSTALEIMKELSRSADSCSFWRTQTQDNDIQDEDIQFLFFKAYFMNISRQIKSSKVYSVLRNQSGTSFIHPGSSLIKLSRSSNTSLPQDVVFYTMLSTSRSFMIGVIPVQAEWFSAIPLAFKQRIDERISEIPTDLIRFDRISPALAFKLIGRGTQFKKRFEKEQKCSMYYDEQSLRLEIWCSSVSKARIEDLINQHIESLRGMNLMEKEVEFASGTVRAVYGAGYEIKRLLFEDEVESLYITGLPKGKSEESIATFISMKSRIRSIDHVEILHEDEDGINAIIHISNPVDANQIKNCLDNEIWETNKLSVSFAGLKPMAQPANTLSQLILSWATGLSTGEATIDFSTASAANDFLLRQIAFSNDFRCTLGPLMIKPFGNLLDFKGTGAMNPKFEKLPAISNGLFIVNAPSTMNQNVTTAGKLSYRVIIKGLSSEVDEFQIKQSINAFFRSNGLNKPQFLVRVKRTEVVSEDGDLNLQLAEITKLIPRRESLASEPLSFYDPRIPQRAGFYLRYKTHEDTLYALADWERNPLIHKTLLYNQPIRMEGQFSTTFNIHEALWKDMYQGFNTIAMNSMKKFSNLLIYEKENKTFMKNPRRLFIIQSDQLDITKYVSDQLQSLLTPEEFQPSIEDMRKLLFSKVVTSKLKEISDQETYIHWDKSKQKVFIYGIDHTQRQRGKEKIEKLLQDMIHKYESFQISIKNQKSIILFNDLWKNQRKGISFEDHIFWYRIIRGKQPIIEFFGTKHGKTIILSWLKKENLLAEENHHDPSNNIHDNPLKWNASEKDCDVCFCEIGENPYYLTACQHGGCRPCFEYQFMSANHKEYVDTPICCDFCSPRKFMAFQDIRALSTSIGLETIKRCALNKYLRENMDKVRRCPNEITCEQILDVRSFISNSNNQRKEEKEGGQLLGYCQQCTKQYCLSCSDHFNKPIKAHLGETCEEARRIGLSDKHRYRNLILEACTLKCPHCKGAFVDFTGCCAVTCHCEKNFCGLCLLPCPDSKKCHDHVKKCSLNQQPGNYFNSEDEIKAAHKLLRIRSIKQLITSIPSSMKKDVLLSCEKDLLDFQIYLFDLK